MGRKKDPFYRIIAIDESKKTNGPALDLLGSWYPKVNELVINREKLSNWVAKGAQVTAAVAKLMEKTKK